MHESGGLDAAAVATGVIGNSRNVFNGSMELMSDSGDVSADPSWSMEMDNSESDRTGSSKSESESRGSERIGSESSGSDRSGE